VVSLEPLISPAELAVDLSSPLPPLVIDARPAHEFARGQIAGAVHLDVWGMSLIDTSDAPLRAFMWMIGHLCSLRGVTPDRPVVVYEADSGIRAARVFWFLEYLGHPMARVLDGGLRAWTTAGLPISTDPQPPTTSAWHGTPQPDRLATWQQVRDVLGRGEVAIVDTRSADEHAGRVVRAKRGGSIPGAVNLEWTRNLEADGRFKSAAALRALYEPLGVMRGKQVITYCQGGYRAAHTYLALRILEYSDVRNYTGSWKEWGDREDLPIVVPPGA
jgi:thiosulfate/3-mercaptopyruvate sulfurtransferase